jgi:hypothetical protein
MGKGSSQQRREQPDQAKNVAGRKSKDSSCATSEMGKGANGHEKGCCLILLRIDAETKD